MPRLNIPSGGAFEPVYGYSRAVICATDGRLCELLPTR